VLLNARRDQAVPNIDLRHPVHRLSGFMAAPATGGQCSSQFEDKSRRMKCKIPEARCHVQLIENDDRRLALERRNWAHQGAFLRLVNGKYENGSK
jgi:hypothetical protein